MSVSNDLTSWLITYSSELLSNRRKLKIKLIRISTEFSGGY